MIPGTIVQGCCHRLTNHGTMYYMTLLSPLGNFPMCSRVAIVLESNHFPRFGDGPTIPSMSKGHVTVNPMIPGTTVRVSEVAPPKVQEMDLRFYRAMVFTNQQIMV